MSEVEELVEKVNYNYGQLPEGHPALEKVDTLTCSMPSGTCYNMSLLDFAWALYEQAYDYEYLEDSEDEEDEPLREEADALMDVFNILENLSDEEKKFLAWHIICKYSSAAHDKDIPSRGRKHVLDYATRAEHAKRLLPLAQYLKQSLSLAEQVDEQVKVSDNVTLKKCKESTSALMPTFKALFERVTDYLAYFV